MKRIYVDIDGTICTIAPDADYAKAAPLKDNIAVINSFFDKGHKVIYWTARGSETGRDWREVTVKQFKEWGVKYHGLEFKKPTYDIFIDDKAVNAAALRRFIKGD
jgi:CMP-N,N'-diacetyllegionaminic acid synthase